MKFFRLICTALTIVLFLSFIPTACAVSYECGDAFSTNTLAITTSRVHLRAKASTHSRSIEILPKNTVLKVYGESSTWAKVLYHGNVGYVNMDYLITKNIDDANVIGVYTTFFSTHQKGRVKNIKKAAGLLTETVIEPGETFSLLRAIGPINKSNGYFEAPEFKRTPQGTETVTGYGGGVCQIATTLYQSVCDTVYTASNIEIVERHRHSKSVSYIEDGQDATISWNAKQDLKIKNNNFYTIEIIAFVKGNSLTCIILHL